MIEIANGNHCLVNSYFASRKSACCGLFTDDFILLVVKVKLSLRVLL